MKRYKKANEGLHAPEELKEKAARSAAKRGRAPWMGAVAAVLAVALIGGIAVWGHAGGLFTLGGRGGEGTGTFSAHALSLAVYPEMHPYPREDDYFDHKTFDFDRDQAGKAYEEAYVAWWEDMQALRSDTDYTGVMDDFLSRSTAQFLIGAGEDNRVCSPLNIYMALSMLAETAGGNSRQQILDVLGVNSIEALHTRAAALWKDHYRDDGTVTSILGNSLWLRDDMTYSQGTLDTLAKDYYASSFTGEMGTEEYNQALRDWLNEQTRGLLEEQVSQLEMKPETVLALASTIYFKAAWSEEFNKESTETDVFHALSGDVDADFMRQTLEDAYYWGEHFAAVQLRFQQSGSMWLILPDEGCSVDELLESGEAMEFLMTGGYGHYDWEKGEVVGAWPNQKRLNIHLSLPKFDVSSDLDLVDGLQNLGVTDVFDYRVSNFDPLGAGTDDPLYVNRVQHAARVKVDEEGCEAAAYTVMILITGAAAPPDDEVDFILDRPFLFAITGSSNLPLFVGVVNQPNG